MPDVPFARPVTFCATGRVPGVIDNVFAALTDPARMPAWLPGCGGAVSDDPIGQGVHIRARFRSRVTEFVVVDYAPPHRFGWAERGQRRGWRLWFRLNATAGGTALTICEVWAPASLGASCDRGGRLSAGSERGARAGVWCQLWCRWDIRRHVGITFTTRAICRGVVLSGRGCGPGLHEFEGHDAGDALEIARVVGYQNDPGFAAREGQQYIVAERFRKSAEVQSLASSQFRQNVPRVLPRVGRRGYEPPPSPIQTQHVALEQSSVIVRPGASPEFLSHDRAQVLERCKQLMEALQAGVRLWIAEPLDEEVRVQEELALDRGTHESGASGEVSSTPRMARVPSTSS